MPERNIINIVFLWAPYGIYKIWIKHDFYKKFKNILYIGLLIYLCNVKKFLNFLDARIYIKK